MGWVNKNRTYLYPPNEIYIHIHIYLSISISIYVQITYNIQRARVQASLRVTVEAMRYGVGKQESYLSIST